MKKLTVIIVNYNVRYFIEQAIVSVKNACISIKYQIIVVDNDSQDDSVALIKEKFPEVKLIENKENVGFGKANNQAIKMVESEYVLLLNPDTVLQEDTINTCIDFMAKQQECGAIGVKMIDGKGKFLPESKRSLPTPYVAFSKMIGLSSLFPKSKKFGKYHLGYLDKDKNHEVEVLSGAFMFFRANLLKEIGGFDEDYFMYGEDIDLSYQVLKKGYKNYYVADTSIIHYKGESTKKGSLNYVKVFYEAMLIFAKKHFSPQQAKVYSIAIYFAIFFKGITSLLFSFIKKIALPILDFLLSYGVLFLLAHIWASKVKAIDDYYPTTFYTLILPFYSLAWVFSNFISGGYEKPYRVSKILKGVLFGTLIIAAIYGFLPENLRFSRAIILLGAVFTWGAMLVNRLAYNIIFNRKFRFELQKNSRLIIVGEKEEAKRALGLLQDSVSSLNFIGFVSANGTKEHDFLGDFKSLEDIVSLYQIDEIVFCNKNISSQKIINAMALLGSGLNYKILPEDSMSIIGSNSKNTAGDLYAIDVNLRIASQRSKVLKRSLDIIFAIFLFVNYPIFVWFVKNKHGFLSNIINVLLGKKTWVSYHSPEKETYKLPKLKKGIISPYIIYNKQKTLNSSKVNLLYAKNYSVFDDLRIVFKGFTFLGS